VLNGPLVHFEEGVGLRRHLEQQLRGGARLEPALELPTIEAILTYVRGGFGNSILPEFALAGCRQGELSVRRLSRWIAPLEIRACWHRKRRLSRAAELLLELLPAGAG
jgi:DNA-binding transcriptional LysR family regulator